MRALALLTSLGFLATACDLSDPFGKRDSTVQVFVTHHATPENGGFPNLGDAGQPRVFTTDEGWNVTLQEAFVVTSAVTLIRCDGDEIELDRYWGPLPENLQGADLGLHTFGAAKVSPGEICSVRVAYGPFAPEEVERDAQLDVGEDPATMTGASFYLSGFAERDGEIVPFELRGTDTIVVEADISGTNGEPVQITGEEPFPVELTLAKTYDRFFDALDFSAFDAAELDIHVEAVLEAETSAHLGDRLTID